MRSLFYTSLIVAGALLLAIAFFPRGEFLPVFRAPDTIGEGPRSSREAGPATPPPHEVAGEARGTPTTGASGPKVETLEELTRNWSVIPASAFPRKVKLLRDAEFKSAVGSSRLPAGKEVIALACDQGVLNLAPDEASPVRGMARVGDTDLKAQIRETYDKWAAARLETLLKQEAEKHRDDPPGIAAPVPGGVDERGKPVRVSDGTYPVLVASMKSGQVTDITPKKVKMWGTPQLTTMEGRPTWVIDVDYDTIVFCGPITARAQAHVRDGQVIRWVYPGSGEPVP